MKTGLLIEARCHQGRWPEKILAKLGGKPMIEQIVIKAKKVEDVIVVISTSMNPEDDYLESLAERHEIECYRGDPEDCVLRHYDCMCHYDLDYAIILPGNMPFFDVGEASILAGQIKEHPGHDCYNLTLQHRGFILPGSVLFAYSRECVKHEILLPNRDGRNIHGSGATFWHWRTYDELKNVYLIQTCIAYPFEVAYFNRMIEHIGHMPDTYEEIVKAYTEIEKL